MTLHISPIYPYFSLLMTPLYICHMQILLFYTTQSTIKIPNLPQKTAITLNVINLIHIENDRVEKTIKFLGISMDLYGLTRCLRSPIDVWCPFPQGSFALATYSMAGQQHTDALDSFTFTITRQLLFHIISNQC